MTNREAFEDWYEVDSYPCEHSNWFRKDADGDYEIADVATSWNAWQAAIAHATQQERKPHTEAEVQEILGLWNKLCDREKEVRRILGVPAP